MSHITHAHEVIRTSFKHAERRTDQLLGPRSHLETVPYRSRPPPPRSLIPFSLATTSLSNFLALSHVLSVLIKLAQVNINILKESWQSTITTLYYSRVYTVYSFPLTPYKEPLSFPNKQGPAVTTYGAICVYRCVPVTMVNESRGWWGVMVVFPHDGGHVNNTGSNMVKPLMRA